MKPSNRTIVISCGLSVLLSGCVLGPGSLRHSRANYNQAIQQTAREELLLNLVRLKYHQSEEFIGVPSITGQFSYNASLGGSGGWQEGVAASLGLALGLNASSSPTIVFTPEQDQEFNKRLLTPIGLETIDLLTSKGWAFDRVLRVTVRNINDVDNATSAGGPTPSVKPSFEEFTYLCGLMRELQKQGRQIEIAYDDRVIGGPVQVSSPISADEVNMRAIVLAAEKGFRFQPSKDGKTQSLWTQPSMVQALVLRTAPGAKDSHELQEIRRLLELAPQDEPYGIVSDHYGQLQRPHSNRDSDKAGKHDRKELVVSTRSLKEMMFFLSHGISVPHSHVEQRLVQQTYDGDGQPFHWGEMTGDLFCVRMQKSRPRNAAVAVPYRGYWFYVDESDLSSKSTFNLLLELFNLEIRAGGSAQIPLLTI